MTKKQKIFRKLLSGSKNVAFSELVLCVEAFGFKLSRISGSHHIYTHPEVLEIINLQEVDGKVKPYQIKQFLQIVERYNLQMEDK